MKFPTKERVLPDLALTSAERDQFKLTAKVLVEDTIAQYETYTRIHQRKISRAQWKPVKKRENLTVFRERRRFVRHQNAVNATAAGNDALEYQINDENDDVLLEPILTPSTVRSTLSHQAPAMAIMGATADRSTVNRPTTVATAGCSAEWRMPTLLMLGSIVGSLDDVMYGVSTFDGPSMLLKTTYTHDELIDGEILNQIQGPTPEEPFTFLGIKWIVKGNHSGIAAVVRPRDLVILESTGIETRWNGERYGYHLMHSVDLPEYGPLKQKSVLRGRVSSCVVYRELANGTVDVYMKANFEPNGNVGESVAILSAANGLSYCWRSVVCAQNKKLSWMLETKENWTTGGDEPRSTTASTRTTETSNGKKKSKDKHVCCNVCRRSSNAFRHMSSCHLCQLPMCSRCRVTKKLSCVGETWRKEIFQRDVMLCKSCVTRSTKSDTYQVARDEVLSGKWDVDESDNLSFELLPGQRGNTRAEHEQQRRKFTTDNGLDRTLKLSIARMQSEEDAGSSYAESFPISGNLWASSFESDTQLEGDFRYTENAAQSSELPLVRTSTNFVNVSSTDTSGATTPSATARNTQPSHFVDLSDVTSSEFARFSSQFNRPKEESAYPLFPPSYTRRSAASSASSTGLSQHQQQLLHQMEQLRVAAEQVYQYTKHNSEVHARASAQQWPSVW
ncbi:hypothetical protein FI667_g8495, partial [Globisporangium splendens]